MASGKLSTSSLTPDQKEIYDHFVSFLLSEKNYFFISGGAGTGKTHLLNVIVKNALKDAMHLGKILNKEVYYSFTITASTNKAVNNLRASNYSKVTTTHSAFGMRVVYAGDGTKKLKCEKPIKYARTILIIDEVTMLSADFIEYCVNQCSNSKFLFVGDAHQLSCVTGRKSWWPIEEPNPQDPDWEVRFLNNNIRAGNKDLADLNKKLKEQVNLCINNPSYKFMDIVTNNNNIKQLNDDELKTYIEDWFTEGESKKILCFTNNKVAQYIQYFNKVYGDEYVEIDKTYTVNSPAHCLNCKDFVRSDETVIVRDIVSRASTNPWHPHKRVRLYSLDAGEERGWYNLADSRPLYFKAKKDLKDESLVDLIPGYACTIHKSQGSTYDEVVIDLDSFSQCFDAETAARLLYVACSRARKNIYFYGKLPTRYGRII